MVQSASKLGQSYLTFDGTISCSERTLDGLILVVWHMMGVHLKAIQKRQLVVDSILV